METNRSTFFRISGWAALAVVGLTLAEIIFFSFFPQPAAVWEWFALFQQTPLLGLINFWLLELPMYLMFIVVFLALYFQLGESAPGRMALALSLVLVGSAIFFSTNNPFTMLNLSSRYAAAGGEAEKSALLAAGEAVLAGTNQRAFGGFNIGLLLVSGAGLLASSTMFQSPIFSRATALTGFLAHGFSLVDYLRQALTQEPLVALLVILPGALLIMVWFGMVGVQLLKTTNSSRADFGIDLKIGLPGKNFSNKG